MSAKRSLYLACCVVALVFTGVVASASADTGDRGSQLRHPDSLLSAGSGANSLPFYYPRAPQVTPTPALPDYVPYIAWDPSYLCPYPVLQIGSRNNGAGVCWTFTMRLENSTGDHRDFPVPNESFGYLTIPCQLGSCVPYSWVNSQPFTLTVDYGNVLPETNENNNTTIFTDPPPQSAACAMGTGTPTPTTMPSSTPTPTHTPSFPDLVGSAQWVSRCPLVLELRTQLYGDSCASAGPSHTQLQNSAGDFIIFPVSALQDPYRIFAYDCEIGNCVPDSWLYQMPFTLTVDVNNEVYELNGEDNNVSTFSEAPPPCPLTPTPATSPTPTASPTPTDTPGTLVGHVTLQGIAQPGTRNNRPVTLSLCAGATRYYTVTLDNQAFFTLTTGLPPAGTYNYKVKTHWNLANAGVLTLTGSTTSVEFGSLNAGDAENNNVVNSSDFNALKNSFGVNNQFTDFNNDGVVNTADFNLMKGNFGTVGRELVCP